VKNQKPHVHAFKQGRTHLITSSATMTMSGMPGLHIYGHHWEAWRCCMCWYSNGLGTETQLLLL